MLVRIGGIALACAIGLPIAPAMAQVGYPNPPRVAAGPYGDETPPGYYQPVPRGYVRRLPRRFYEENGVVYDRYGRRVIFYDAETERPSERHYERPTVRRYVRVVPGPYADEDGQPPRPYFRGREDSPIAPYDRRVAPEDARSRDRQAALPPADEPDSRTLPPAGEPQVRGRQSALPPEADDAVKSQSPADLAPRLRRQIVRYPTKEPAGSIIVDTRNTYLYYVLGDGQAVRYGIGVGREGFTWSGREKVSRMSEWPDWYPPADMLERQPYLPRMMAGGPGNPLGARALYLGNTLFRIHGTSDASSIGNYVSSGCIRLLNEDIEDLYRRVRVGTRVVVLRGGKRPRLSGSAQR